MRAAAADIDAVYDYRAEWRSITCPTLIVGGSRSWLAQQPLKDMAEMIPTARYFRVDGAGHDVHLDAPAELLDIITRQQP